jgi:hypothetical protein
MDRVSERRQIPHWSNRRMPGFQSGGAGATPAWGTHGVSTGVRFQRGLISRMAHKAYVGSNPTAPTVFIEWTSLEWSRVSETRERGFKSLLGDWIRAVREPGFIYQSGRLGHVGSNPTCSTGDGQVRKPAKRSVREADVCGFDSHPDYSFNRDAQSSERSARRSLVPWSSGQDGWFTSSKRWFESIRDHSWGSGLME